MERPSVASFCHRFDYQIAQKKAFEIQYKTFYPNFISSIYGGGGESAFKRETWGFRDAHLMFC